MKTLVLIAAGVSALALTGCIRPMAQHRALQPISRLDCPTSQGQFDRVAVAPDGKSCDYSGPDGGQLHLKLVSFAGDADTVLDPVDAQMKTLLPPEPATPPTPPGSSAPPAGDGHNNVNIDLPGISIHADDKNANVHVAGVHIDADGQNNSVKINGGGHGPGGQHGQFTVNANDNGAVIRTEAFGPNVERSIIRVAKAASPAGWRTVGYEALGPKSGPLVIADFQTKADDHDELFSDVKALAWRAARNRG